MWVNQWHQRIGSPITAYTHRPPTLKPECVMFVTAFPDFFASVTEAQCEPALFCEVKTATVVDLPVPVFSGKCQLSCTMLSCEHKSQ